VAVTPFTAGAPRVRRGTGLFEAFACRIQAQRLAVEVAPFLAQYGVPREVARPVDDLLASVNVMRRRRGARGVRAATERPLSVARDGMTFPSALFDPGRRTERRRGERQALGLFDGSSLD